MTLEEWRRAKEVFDVAWELEPRARESYLAAACGAKNPCAPRSGVCCSALAQNEDFLEEPLLFDAALLPAGEQAGRIVGRYRLVREIGRGGMGSVHRLFAPTKSITRRLRSNSFGQGRTPPGSSYVSGRSGGFWPRSIIPTSRGCSTAARRKTASFTW